MSSANTVFYPPRPAERLSFVVVSDLHKCLQRLGDVGDWIRKQEYQYACDLRAPPLYTFYSVNAVLNCGDFGTLETIHTSTIMLCVFCNSCVAHSKLPFRSRSDGRRATQV